MARAALADIADEPFAAAEIRRCDELWLQAKELAIDADLAAGRNEDALREAMALAAEHPLREHAQAQRMLALYRTGRQADALEAFRVARARLVDQIGSEPGPSCAACMTRSCTRARRWTPPRACAPPTAPRLAGRVAGAPGRRSRRSSRAWRSPVVVVRASTRRVGDHHDRGGLGRLDRPASEP